jgi:HD superfamily phosphohydrolase
MIIHDPLYGAFEVPRFLDRLILAPEVRRLMGVRLLNAPSPSLPTLSEVRRFSHTLGVLRLALLNPHIGLTRDEVRALTATILIHDAATPPFAHLLEYYLKDRAGWDHESALPDLLTGHNLVGNTAHQILPGEQLKYKRLCDASKIDFDTEGASVVRFAVWRARF